MPREPKVIPVSDEEYARQKQEKADRCLRFLVTGEMGIRDAIERTTRRKGEHVMLDPEETVILLLTKPGWIKADPIETPAPASEADAPVSKPKAK